MVGGGRNPIAEGLTGLLAPAGLFVATKGIARLQGLAGVAGESGGFTAASKTPKMKDPKELPQRPFHDDYPKGYEGPRGSAITMDVDGNPLGARYIVGRRTVGGGDEGLSGSEIYGAGSSLGLDQRLASFSGEELRGNAGRYTRNGDQSAIYVDQAQPLHVQQRIYAHELGHALDDRVQGLLSNAGSKIPTNGIKKELAKVYEDLNTHVWYKPGRGATPQLSVHCSALRAVRPSSGRRLVRLRGFTLIELMVVVTLIAIASAGVVFSMRDSGERSLAQEGERLAALLEAARAQSRASGVAVRWRPLPGGFAFDGLPGARLPDRWLDRGTVALGATTLQLGPEPLIGPQRIVLTTTSRPDRVLGVATDGLRPFTISDVPAP